MSEIGVWRDKDEEAKRSRDSRLTEDGGLMSENGDQNSESEDQKSEIGI